MGNDEFVDEDGDDYEENFEESEQSSEESLEEDDQEEEVLEGQNPDSVDDQEDDVSEGWETGDDAQQENHLVGFTCISMDDKQGESMESLPKLDTCFKPQDVQRLETSAIMGVGLQELLNAIDEKLNSLRVVEKSNVDCFDRKWRPPQRVDTGAAVEN